MITKYLATGHRIDPAVLVLVAVAIQIGLSYLIVTGQVTALVLVAAAVAAIVILAMPTERILLLLFGYAAFSGLVKLLANYHPIAHVSLDMLFLLLLGNWFLRERWSTRSSWPPALLPLCLFAGWTGLILLAPISHVVIGLGSIKAYILPMALYLVAYRTVQSRRQLRHFFALTVGVTVVMAIVALIQQQLGPTLIASWGPSFARTIHSANYWYSETLAVPVFRPFSTAPEPYAAALYMMIGLLATLTILQGWGGNQHRLPRWLVPVGGAVLLAGYMVTLLIIGVRQVWYETLIGLVVLAVFGGVSATGARSLFLALAAAAIFVLSNQAIVDRLASIAQPVDAYATERGGYLLLIPPSIEQFPFGRGLGSAGIAPKSLQEFFGLGDTGTFISADNMFLIMVYESGVVGLALFVLMNAVLLLHAVTSLRRLRDSRLRVLGAGLLAIMVGVVATYFGGGALMTAPANLYFWFAAGVLVKLPEIERRERSEALDQR